MALTLGPGALAVPAGAYPVGQIGTAQINATVFAPGSTVVVTVENTTPGALSMQIFSAPVTIGTGTVGAGGTGSVSGAIPAGYSGAHTIQVTGAGGEIFPFSITVTGGSTSTPTDGGGRLACTNPPTVRVVDRHTIYFADGGCSAPPGTPFTVTLTDGDWSASLNGVVDANGGYSVAGNATDPAHLLPLGTSRVTFVTTDDTGNDLGGGYFDITIGANVTPTPSVTVSSSTSAGAGSVGAGNGSLASTGAQIALGAGVGIVALCAGGLLLVLGRRRTARYGG